jgi:hypothetical protein
LIVQTWNENFASLHLKKMKLTSYWDQETSNCFISIKSELTTTSEQRPLVHDDHIFGVQKLVVVLFKKRTVLIKIQLYQKRSSNSV